MTIAQKISLLAGSIGQAMELAMQQSPKVRYGFLDTITYTFSDGSRLVIWRDEGLHMEIAA
jgi:hypothetical protein